MDQGKRCPVGWTACEVCSPAVDRGWARWARLRWYRQAADRWVRRMESARPADVASLGRARAWRDRLAAAEADARIEGGWA